YLSQIFFEGDILVFGVEELPDKMVHCEELLDIVNKQKGGCY
ncbi:MAG TPA: histidinol-phosphatase, partial [Clostridiaceae bacterium]|nr:histidinol-phosphatase [Clostridiaceae bacterium]HBN27898.1 histidinol-phosphatase [Clostridiaceae bacterium]HBX48529.1 histidinol-phosphatase [Clostridiaceae bacterium]HCL50879.1 histidinol-phosphatase [Clostridiaceae bacterium]